MFPREDYIKALADHITVSVEDLNDTELALINKSYAIFNDRLSDMKALQDEVKRLSIDLANQKAMYNEPTTLPCDHRYHSRSGRYMLYEDWCEKCGTDCHVV
jgi:hypothetical protein